MDIRQPRSAHPAGRRDDMLRPVSDDDWGISLSSMLGGESSTFLEDYQGPLAKITPIGVKPPRWRTRAASAIVRALVYLGQSLEDYPEQFDW